MKKEISYIVTPYGHSNIGNRLQNYALQEVLHSYFSKVISLAGHEPPFIGWKGKIVKALGFPKHKAIEKRMIEKRREHFIPFSSQHLHIEDAKSVLENQKLISAGVFVVGSDQIWADWDYIGEEFAYIFLDFVPKNKRICFAPSFGFDTFPPEKRERYIQGLNGFRHLSCREQSGCDLIKAATGREATLLVDPTMLLTTDEWDAIAKKPEYTVPERFMLVYFLGGKSRETQKEIHHLADKNNLEIVDIYDAMQADYFLTAPDEFLYLVKQAEIVCTDSFHGCVFSILYKKQLRYFLRNGALGTQMSNRQKTLFEKFKIFDETGNCDYSNVDTILENERKKAREYLEMVLADTE